MIKIMFLIVLLSGTSQTFAQEVQSTSSNTQESTIYDQMQVQSDTIVETPTQLGDIPLEELEAFDPSTVPESVPIPEADWIFEVPISVKNIPANIQKLGVQVFVYRVGGLNGYPIRFGISSTKVQLTNGAFDGNVIVGVSYDEELVIETREPNKGTLPPEKATKYNVNIFLVGPDNSWMRPSLKQVTPAYRIADASQPFIPWINESLPKNYTGNQ